MASLEALKWLIAVPDGALVHTHTYAHAKDKGTRLYRIILVFL